MLPSRVAGGHNELSRSSASPHRVAESAVTSLPSASPIYCPCRDRV